MMDLMDLMDLMDGMDGMDGMDCMDCMDGMDGMDGGKRCSPDTRKGYPYKILGSGLWLWARQP